MCIRDSKKLLLISNKKKKYAHYKCFDIPDDLRRSIKELSMSPIMQESPQKLFVVSTNADESSKFNGLDFTFTGFSYAWPVKHQGLLTPKPVLRSLLEKVMQ